MQIEQEKTKPIHKKQYSELTLFEVIQESLRFLPKEFTNTLNSIPKDTTKNDPNSDTFTTTTYLPWSEDKRTYCLKNFKESNHPNL